MFLVVLTVANNMVIGAGLPNVFSIFLVAKSFKRRNNYENALFARLLLVGTGISTIQERMNCLFCVQKTPELL